MKLTPKQKAGLSDALIKGGYIVIRVPISALPVAYQAGIDSGFIEPRYRITNAKAFAKDVVRALNDEEEDGTTPIHRLMDKACEEAIEQGAEGVEEFNEDDEVQP